MIQDSKINSQDLRFTIENLKLMFNSRKRDGFPVPEVWKIDENR